MKRIALCFDGTWNTPSDKKAGVDNQAETNVSRISKSIAATGPDGVQQACWYNPGVGTDWYDHLTGGIFGAGLDHHIIEGYRYLVDTYSDGDEVFVFGFSRGAYAARSMVGMIRNCGLLKPGGSGSNSTSVMIGTAYGIYRTRGDGQDSSVAAAFRRKFAQEIDIKFLGVWDTVGGLGIPLQIAQQLDTALYEFHDTKLSHIVKNAYQAIALDEHRIDYKVCLWDPSQAPTQTLQQRWFIGAHADVGGGYADRNLSDIALRWMQDRAAALGLGLTPVLVKDSNYLSAPVDSYGDFLDGLYAETCPIYQRPVCSTKFGNEVLDSSIDRRRRDVPGYVPCNPGLPPLNG